MSITFSFSMMTVEEQVMAVARCGKIQQLTAILEKKTLAGRKSIVCTLTNGATPLMVASQHGYSSIVQYLIEKCHADIEQGGQFFIDQDIIIDASPLWCASAAGQYAVVKQLCNYKANINCLTKSHSTPLRAACYDGRLNIVKFLISHGADVELPNQYGHTCLMIACYKGHIKVVNHLLHCGANVNKGSIRGNTALHDAAEANHVEIVKVLLKNRAVMSADYLGLTPIVSAAHAGSKDVVHYLVRNELCSMQEKIDSLDLLGATFIDQQRDVIKALHCWGLSLRLQKENPGTFFIKPMNHSYINNHLNTRELVSLDKLEEILLHPDDLRIHALLIRERVLGQTHPETVYYIHNRGATYADMGNLEMCVKVWLYGIDIQQNTLEPCASSTLSSFMSFIELFNFSMEAQLLSNKTQPSFKFKDWMSVFCRTVKEIKSGMQTILPENKNKHDLFYQTVIISLNILAQFHEHLVHYTKAEEAQLNSILQELVKLNPRGQRGESILHMICRAKCNDIVQLPSIFPCIKAVQLLLTAGAIPNALDDDYNTPLHEVARCYPDPKSPLFKLLLEHGAHLDLRNKEGKTALDLIPFPDQVEVCSVRYLTLQCLCAQTICKSKINYHGILPERLEYFLELH